MNCSTCDLFISLMGSSIKSESRKRRTNGKIERQAIFIFISYYILEALQVQKYVKSKITYKFLIITNKIESWFARNERKDSFT